MVTQKDISVACGVSVAAVSRALNDHADISAGTKQRIKDMAEKMGYVKNSAKKKRDHTYLIGILFTEKELTVFHNEIIIEIREYLIKWGYDLLILNPVEKEKGAAERPGYLSRARLLGLEGILLFSNIQEEAFCLSPEQKGLRELVFGEIPVVAVDCGFAFCRCVRPAYEEGIRKLFDYIYSLGHRRIAFLSGKDSMYQNILEKEIRLITSREGQNIPHSFFCFLKAGSEEEAAEKTLELLGEDRWLPPTCILFGDDTMMQGGIKAILQRKLRIPEDISVAALSFKNSRTISGRTVTSWKMPPDRIAKEAVDMIIREIRVPGGCSQQTQFVRGDMIQGETAQTLSKYS